MFQIESRAQMQMLKRTRPESLDDLTVQVALVRPGPIIGGAVHPYIERRKALREDPSYEVPYEHPSLEPVLRDTLGTIVFQDQVLEVAMAFAGFTAGEAEGLRRAMSRKRSEAAIRAYEEKFIEGALERGAAREVAERVWTQIVGFSGFGFPKAHSAAFGLLAYQSTWLRVHYHPEFLCGLLNEQPMGFYPPDALVHEAQRRGVEVLPPCVVRSDAECRVEDSLAVRMGLGYVTGVKEAEVRALGRASGRPGGARSATSPGAPARPRRRSDGSRGPAPATRLWTAPFGQAPPRALDARRGRARHPGPGGDSARPAAGSARGAGPARAQRLGAHAGRLRLDRGHAARAPARADAARPAGRPAHERGARATRTAGACAWPAS